jgi:hypothetical protein
VGYGEKTTSRLRQCTYSYCTRAAPTLRTGAMRVFGYELPRTLLLSTRVNKKSGEI